MNPIKNNLKKKKQNRLRLGEKTKKNKKIKCRKYTKNINKKKQNTKIILQS